MRVKINLLSSNLIFFSSFSLFLLILVNIFVFAEEKITYSYYFNKPNVIYNSGFHFFQIDGTSQSITAGKPILPFKMARILLPFGSTAKSIKVTRISPIKFEGNYNLSVAKTMLPLSFKRMNNKSSEDRNSYLDFETDVEYPLASTYSSNQIFHGYNILLNKINPIYISPSKEIFFSSEIKIEIEVEVSTQKSMIPFKNIKTYHNEVMNFIDNKYSFEKYTYKDTFAFKNTSESSYDYLIVSTSKLINSTKEYNLNTLKNYLETNKKLKIKIANISEVLSNSTGVDNAQKLRNFIKKEYLNSNIKYVLLVGDSDEKNPMIPYRKLYSKIRGYNGSWQDISDNITADFYYACLDGDFNGNNNNTWGEPTDGINGGDVDFLCEVTIGRMPVDNETELSNVIKKTIDVYNSSKRNKNTFLLGEELFKELDLWGGNYMDQLIGIVNDHGFISNGFDGSWNIKKMYDTNNYEWSGSQASTEINNKDYLIINHLGHSNQTYNMRINGGWFYREFQNEKPFFYYTQGCFPGHFLTDDSIIELFFTSEKGAFATISNSSYGLGPEDPDPNSTKSPGTSQILNRYFINRLLMENELQFAIAHKKSKEDILIYIDHQEARWVIWATNYFGDPALSIRM